METTDMREAFKRIMAGQRATLVIPKANEEQARAILAKLSPGLRARLTIEVK